MKMSREKCQQTCISSGKVALKNIVCLEPHGGMSICCTIFLIWGSKPMSNIRSASSNAKHFIIQSETLALSIISTNRPGVATKMSTPFSKLCNCRIKSQKENGIDKHEELNLIFTKDRKRAISHGCSPRVLQKLGQKKHKQL